MTEGCGRHARGGGKASRPRFFRAQLHRFALVRISYLAGGQAARPRPGRLTNIYLRGADELLPASGLLSLFGQLCYFPKAGGYPRAAIMNAVGLHLKSGHSYATRISIFVYAAKNISICIQLLGENNSNVMRLVTNTTDI